MLSPNFFNTVFVFPILNLLMLLYKGFLTLNLPGAFGWSIISLTLLVRLVLHPFFRQQLETAKKIQDMKPHLDKLSHKHKSDPKKLQQEQLRLYQEAGINPASGCVFMIIQIPIFIALYNTLSLFLLNGGAGKIAASINKDPLSAVVEDNLSYRSLVFRF
jgi:YidC/Oxa1 family membrane protein insertase